MLNKAREAATEHIGENGKASSSAIQDRLLQNVKAGELGQGDLDRYTNAKGQDERIRVILDLIDPLRDKGMQLAASDLAGKMFGSDFEDKLRSGVDMVGRMREAVDGLKVAGGIGLVPPEEISRAVALNAEFQKASDTLALAMLPVIKDIHAWEQDQLQG